MKDAPYQNDFAVSAEIVGNEMQVYKRPEVLTPPEHGMSMKPQMKSQQAQNNTNSNSNNDNNKPTPASLQLPQLLPPLPPPPSFQFFQRQSSVPAYYGGQNALHMPGNHYTNFVQQHTGRPIYTSCGQTLSNNQNTFCRIPATTSEEMGESNRILNSLFSPDESSQGQQQTSYGGETGENSPGSLIKGRRRTSID